MPVSIKLPDGGEKTFPAPPTGLEVARSIGPCLAEDAVGFTVEREKGVRDIRSVLKHGDRIHIVARPSRESLEVIRHSSAHVLAQAVQSLWPEVKVTIGPVIEGGFYYDFDTDKKFTPEDLIAVEGEMKKILKAGHKVTREVWPAEKAIKYFEGKGETLKGEIIRDLNEKEVSVYKQGGWLDLCRGPHVRHLGQIGAVKVLSHSGAYWRGDSQNKQLQRIYGTAFHSEKELKAYLKKREEAGQNDHRLLGKKQDLFWFSETAPGQPFFTPSGTAVYQNLQNFLREKYREYGYEEVITPQVYHSHLFERSGHLQHFAENMYAVSNREQKESGFSEHTDIAGKQLTAKEAKESGGQGLALLKSAVLSALKSRPEGAAPSVISESIGLPRQAGGREGQSDRPAQWLLYHLAAEGLVHNPKRDLWRATEKPSLNFPVGGGENKTNTESPDGAFLKPMNCPGHCLFYKKDRKSYRDLPYRLADFGRLHRNEPAGALHGLTRVRGFCQDDAHVFCRLSQLSGEIQAGIKMLRDIYKTLGLSRYEVELSTRPESRMGEDRLWDQAEEALKDSLSALNIPYKLNPGDGAFYGPKLDISIRDSFDRAWQLGTFQCDFNLPAVFELSYINEQGGEDQPVLVHRALLGSLERFIGVYLEHRKGRLPLWLCPTQAVILPLTDREWGFCGEIQIKLAQSGIICKIDKRNEKIPYKVRQAQIAQIPYMIVIGKRETESGKISLRLREGERFGDLSFEKARDTLIREIQTKSPHSLFLKNKDSNH